MRASSRIGPSVPFRLAALPEERIAVHSDSFSAHAQPEAASMFSSEPLEPSVLHPIPPGAPPAPDNEEWRSEVASRVQSYRARKTTRVATQQSLGFSRPDDNGRVAEPQDRQSVGPESASAAPAPTTAASRPAAAHLEGAGSARERFCRTRTSESESSALDTNYYRRLNAHALEQSAQRCVEQTMDEQEFEAAHLPDYAGSRELALDLELHAAAAGDACLDRYRIADRLEPSACTAAADLGVADQWAVQEPPAAAHVASSRVPSSEAACSANGAAPAPAAATPRGNLLGSLRPRLEPPLWTQPSRDELADPVSRPRILEVPEDIMPTVQGSLFPEIRLDAEEPEPSVRREPKIQMQLPVVPVAARLKAGLADLAVVAAGTGLFAAIAGRAMPEVGGKPFGILLLFVTIVLWVTYQQMFLLYHGRTAGMRLAGIRIATFDGRAPKWSERRSRARHILISCASVALGFLWALLDEDTLCWHDRASRTFPTRATPSGAL